MIKAQGVGRGEALNSGLGFRVKVETMGASVWSLVSSLCTVHRGFYNEGPKVRAHPSYPRLMLRGDRV